jgi:hypothetical protein
MHIFTESNIEEQIMKMFIAEVGRGPNPFIVVITKSVYPLTMFSDESVSRVAAIYSQVTGYSQERARHRVECIASSYIHRENSGPVWAPCEDDWVDIMVDKRANPQWVVELIEAQIGPERDEGQGILAVRLCERWFIRALNAKIIINDYLATLSSEVCAFLTIWQDHLMKNTHTQSRFIVLHMGISQPLSLRGADQCLSVGWPLVTSRSSGPHVTDIEYLSSYESPSGSIGRLVTWLDQTANEWRAAC